MWHRVRPLLLVFPLCAGCNAIVSPSEEQCAADADCTARGFENAVCSESVCVEAEEIDPVWACLGSVTEPEPDPTKTVSFPIGLVYAIGGAPISSDAVIDVCDKLDVNCTGDDPKYPKGINPGADGVVQVEVPEGFDGFVRITDPGIVDSRVYVGRPLIEPPTVEQIQLLKPMEYTGLASLAMSEADPTRGSMIALAIDCNREAVSGVSFDVPSADDVAVPFYLINQAPVLPPNAIATDKDGFGGYFNLLPGGPVVKAFRAADDAYIGESSFQILANTISYVLVGPTPL